MTNPQLLKKAEKALAKVSASTDNAGLLADWAEEASRRDTLPAGVIITRDGTIIAETWRDPGTNWAPGATYVDKGTLPEGITLRGGNEIGSALSQIRAHLGEPVVHMSYWEVGTGKPSPKVASDLKLRRQVLGLSQNELANLLDVKRVTLSTWEQGTRTPPAGVSREIADLEDRQDALTEAIIADPAIEVDGENPFEVFAKARAYRALRRNF